MMAPRAITPPSPTRRTLLLPALSCSWLLLVVVCTAVSGKAQQLLRNRRTMVNYTLSPATDPPETETTTEPQQEQEEEESLKTCDANGFSQFPYTARDSAERLLKRLGVINRIPRSRCENPTDRKNVILVIGDGMGWEMARAGAVARQVIDELESLGCDTKLGCPNNTAAREAFQGRTLLEYYTEGKGSGLSFQELDNFTLVTTSPVLVQEPNPGNLTAPLKSLLDGEVFRHDTGMAELALNDCGYPIDFSPLDHSSQGGNMVLWDDVKGGQYPWDWRYYSQLNITLEGPREDGFDPTFIIQHTPDSAGTATTLATGHKTGNSMLSVNLYEEEVPTLVEEAMQCGMAAGTVTSVPLLHATPGAFITHSNHRRNNDQVRRGFQKVNPTFASGVCTDGLYPVEEVLQSMRNGTLSDTWTFFEQQESVMAEDFYNGMSDLDPNKGDHVLACTSYKNPLPYRGVDSSYSQHWCRSGRTQFEDPGSADDPNDLDPVGIEPNPRLCDHYKQDELEQIPHITDSVQAALDFLSKDEDGFFLMYEQGDIDKAAHDTHMDDMLGTMLDINDSVRLIMNWIEANGGWEKNALYVTADHDHYLSLLPHFPEALANLLIAGESHKITPRNTSMADPWDIAIQAGRHQQGDKTQIEHIRDFTTWTSEDVDAVAHYWGAFGSGGNGWSTHSTRPVPLYYNGDDGCIEQLLGKGYQVLGREVEGSPNKIDQVHLHACIKKNLFGL